MVPCRLDWQRGSKATGFSVWSVALMTAAAVVSLRGLPMMAKEGLTMWFYIGFATLFFLIPGAFVSAELAERSTATKAASIPGSGKPSAVHGVLPPSGCSGFRTSSGIRWCWVSPLAHAVPYLIGNPGWPIATSSISLS